MTQDDLYNLIRWTNDTDGYQFAKEIYNREEPDEYTRGKFSDMQKHLIRWVASLDYKNRERLTKAINNQAERWENIEEDEPTEQEMLKAESRMLFM